VDSLVRLCLSPSCWSVSVLFCLFLAPQPPLGQGLLIHDVSVSYTTTQHSRYDSSGRVISSSQGEGWGVSVTPRPRLTPGKDRVPVVQEAEWATGPVWPGVENLSPTGIRSPDRPAGRQSLYRIRYPAHPITRYYNNISNVLGLCYATLL
jgi:hypothetical protein